MPRLLLGACLTGARARVPASGVTGANNHIEDRLASHKQAGSLVKTLKITTNSRIQVRKSRIVAASLPTGPAPFDRPDTCSLCKGAGYALCAKCDLKAPSEKCADCFGWGFSLCTECCGIGHEPRRRPRQGVVRLSRRDAAKDLDRLQRSKAPLYTRKAAEELGGVGGYTVRPVGDYSSNRWMDTKASTGETRGKGPMSAATKAKISAANTGKLRGRPKSPAHRAALKMSNQRSLTRPRHRALISRSKKRSPMHCSLCGQPGHNRRKCPILVRDEDQQNPI